MVKRMERYCAALGQKGLLPPQLLKENVQQMKNLEALFEQSFRKMKVALMRKDVKQIEDAVNVMETALNNAKALLERFKGDAEEKVI